MTRRLGMAVIGLGVGEAHARAIAADARCELRWLCDHTEARAANLQRELGALNIGRSFEQALADPAVDAMVLATFDGDHAAQVSACLQAGRHVFVEKPLCRTRDELESIARLARSAHRQLMVNLVLRAAPGLRRASSMARANRFGTIYAFDGDYLYGRLHKLTEGWRGREPGYSVFAGGGVHLVDLMIGLVGEVPTAVRASGTDLASRGSPYQGPDFVAAEYRFASGLIGRITVNFGSVHRHHHVVRLFGTQGTFLCDDISARCSWQRDPGGAIETLPEPVVASTKGALLPRFIDAIMEPPADDHELVRELAVSAATVAVDEALRCGDWVDVPVIDAMSQPKGERRLYWPE